VAGVAVPGVAWVHGRLAVGADARRFVLVLRRAQARAAATGTPVRVELVRGGRGYRVTTTGVEAATVEHGDFAAACTTNYPAGTLEFAPAGWPCTPGGSPRAGTFTFACRGVSAAVVLQMGGRVRGA